ncbi:MAG: hypothetical protein R3223_08850, partial [Longimicrobiales bacterium]|nr:hypothetical protein [Longimicrobiales bacterium]
MSKWKAACNLGLLAALTLAVTGCLDDTPMDPGSNLAAFSLLGGLETGQALSLQGEEAERIVLPGGATGSEFVLVAFFGTEA